MEAPQKARDTAEPRGFELRDYVRILRAYWFGTALIVLVSVLAGAGWTLTQPRVYAATASGLVQAPTGNDPGMAYAADSLAKSQAVSYEQLARSLAVADQAVKSTKSTESPQALLSRINSVNPENTAIVEITAKGSTPAAASALANAWVKAMSVQVNAIQGDDGLATQKTSFKSLAAASVPSHPISPNVRNALLLAGLIGIVLAFIYALVRNHLDRRVRSAAYVEEQFGVPVLGTLPLLPSLIDGPQLLSEQSVGEPDEQRALFALAESFKELRTNLSYVDIDNPPRVIVITSPRPSDGKSTVAANLAEALAATSGKPVVVIDCDLRRPMVSKIFGVPNGSGLTDALSNRATFSDVMQQLAAKSSNLWVVGSGRIPPNPAELLGSRAMRDVLTRLSQQEAFVILDAPPVLAVTDAAVLSNAADGVLVVVSSKKTTYDQLERTLQLVRRGNGKVLGCVLNRVPTRGSEAREYGYYAGDYYSQAQYNTATRERTSQMPGKDAANGVAVR